MHGWSRSRRGPPSRCGRRRPRRRLPATALPTIGHGHTHLRRTPEHRAHPRGAEGSQRSPRCWCRRAIRTCPSTCPSAGRRGSGPRASPGRWRPSRSRSTAPPSSSTAATGSRPRRELDGSGIELVKVPDAGGHAARRLAGRERRSRARRSPSTASVLSLARRPAAARRARRAAASACAPTSTSSPPPGRIGPAAPRAADLRARRRRGAAVACRQAGAGARRDARGRRHAPPRLDASTTSPGCSTCAAPTSASTRCSSPTCSSRPTRRRSSSSRARSTRRCGRGSRADGVQSRRTTQPAAAVAALPAGRDAARRPEADDARPRASRRAPAASRRSIRARWRRAARARPRRRTSAQAMVEDGAAMCEFYAWFEAALADPSRQEPITELTIDERLTAARARRPGYVGPSFATIAAFNANGAMPHYRADARVARDDRRRRPAADRLRRAVPRRHDRHHAHVADRHARRRAEARRDARCCRARSRSAGRASRAARCRRCSTRSRACRSGSTASTSATAPATASATSSTCTRDRRAISRVVARARDGDGAGDDHQHRAGRVPAGTLGRADREPGAERAGGLVPASEFGEFLEFETLTLCPIDTRCLEPDLLRPDEIDWLNAYHRTVRRAPATAGRRRGARLADRADGADLAALAATTRPAAGDPSRASASRRPRGPVRRKRLSWPPPHS